MKTSTNENNRKNHRFFFKARGILLGEMAVFFAGVLWGVIGYFTRNLKAAGFEPTQIVAVRAFFTTLFMGIIILLKNPKLFRIQLKDLWIFAGMGIASFMFFNICYMTSITLNSLSVACILMYTSPIWITAMSVPLFKEKLTAKKLISLVICLGGCTAVCFSSSLVLDMPAGLIYGLLSGFGYALYSIFGKFAAKRYSPLTTIFYTFLFALLGIVFLADVPKTVSLCAEPRNLLLAVGISVINTLLPYFLYTFGLSKISAGRASVLSIIEPAVSAVTGGIFFGEAIGILGFGGIAGVLGGIALLESDNSEKNEGGEKDGNTEKAGGKSG